MGPNSRSMISAENGMPKAEVVVLEEAAVPDTLQIKRRFSNLDLHHFFGGLR